MKAVTLLILFFCLHTTAFAQRKKAVDSVDFFRKVNDLQIKNYQPGKVDPGKDGDKRLKLQLFKSVRDGKNGKSGKDGPTLNVAISSVIISNLELLQLIVNNVTASTVDTFYVNPAKGQIKIMANGGNGGDGGRGENGNAFGGDGGNAGRGGNGGIINVFIKSKDSKYIRHKCLVFSNEAGYGGYGGSNGSDTTGNSNVDRGIDGRTGVDGPIVVYTIKDN